MSKTKNILLTTTAVAGAFVTVTNGQVVKADTPTTPTASQATTTTDKNSVKADYDKAVAEQQQAKQTAADTKAALEKGQKDVTEAQENVANAEKVVEAATKAKQEATPENIAKTQAQIDAQTKDVATKQDAITVAKQNVTAKEAELKQAKADEDQATADVDASSKTVATEQANVAKAQAAVDGTGAKEALANEQKAKEQVEAAQADVAAKQIAHDAAKSAHDKAQADVTANSKAKKLLETKAEAERTEKELAKAKFNYEKGQKEIASLVKQANIFEKKLGNTNIILLPTEYGNTDKLYYYNDQGVLTKNEEEDKHLRGFRAKGSYMNEYKSNENDKNVIVDPTNLDDKLLTELNMWIVSMLNPVLKQSGYKNSFVLTKQSINYAKIVAEASTPYGFQHVNEALKKGNLYVGTVHFFAESIAMGYDHSITLDTLKKNIYNSMIGMLFEDGDSNWGHANQLSGNATKDYLNPPEVFFGFAIDGNGTLHFESFMPNDVEFTKQGGFLEIPKLPLSDDEIKKLAQTKDNIETTMMPLKKAKVEANTNYLIADIHYIDARGAARADKDYEQKQQAAEQALQALNASFVALTASNDNLKTAQANLTAATKAVADLNADAKDKQARLDQARVNLAKAQANLAQKKVALDVAKQASAKANQALVAAQAQVTAADKDATDAQAKLKDLQAKMVAYKFVDTDLADAKNQLADAKAWLDQVTKAYVALYDANKEAQDALDFKDQTLTTAKAKYDQVLAHEAAQKALEQVQKQQATNQNNKKVVTPTATDKATAQAQTTSTSKTNATLVNTSVQTKATNTKATQVANLPQTGAKAENWLAVLGAMLVGTLGMFGMAKRKRQN